MSTQRIPWLAAAAAGILIWSTVAALTGRAEAWDHGAYWSAGYPILCVVCGVLGWRFPERAWRWGLVAGLSQLLPMLFAGASFSLLPLGLIAFGILSLPLAGMSALAARFSRRRSTGPA